MARRGRGQRRGGGAGPARSERRRYPSDRAARFRGRGGGAAEAVGGGAGPPAANRSGRGRGLAARRRRGGHHVRRQHGGSGGRQEGQGPARGGGTAAAAGGGEGRAGGEREEGLPRRGRRAPPRPVDQPGSSRRSRAPRAGRGRWPVGPSTRRCLATRSRRGEACATGRVGMAVPAGMPVPAGVLTRVPAARRWGGGGRRRRRRWRRRHRRRSCAWPSCTWSNSASTVSPARPPVPEPRRDGSGSRARPSRTVSAAEEERAAAEEEETQPADLIGDRLKEDVVSREAGASPLSRWRRRALPLSRGAAAASAEPPASSPARAEGPAAAPGRQRCKCPALGVPCQLRDQGPSPTWSASCWHPGEERVPCSGTPMPGKGAGAAQLTFCSPCRCSLRIQPASACCGGTSCLSPAWSSLQMTGSSFLLPRTAPSSNASVSLGL